MVRIGRRAVLADRGARGIVGVELVMAVGAQAVQRAAVKLDRIATTLIIGEGVETCMAARQCMATGDIERAPIWPLGSVGAISFG